MTRALAVLFLTIVLSVHPASAQHTKTILVEMIESKFVPETVSTIVGDTVVFINTDASPHTVTQALGSLDSGIVATNAAWLLKVDATGTFQFYCRFNPAMRISILAEQE